MRHLEIMTKTQVLDNLLVYAFTEVWPSRFFGGKNSNKCQEETDLVKSKVMLFGLVKTMISFKKVF